jgi:endonuclease YncB( thermonuclease family)
MYHYEARVEGIIDGDTIEFSVDLGFHLYFREQMRLANYAAPEIRGPERIHGLVAKQKLEEILPVGKIVRINSKKTDKYGRWLADVEFRDTTLSEYLISLGYGAIWDGLGLNPKFDPSAPYPITVGTDKV